MIPRTTSSRRTDAVKVDFESMTIQKSYHRADLRRLSTESYIKEQDDRLATQWLWYREEKSGDWVKYGESVCWNNEKLFLTSACGLHYQKWPKYIFSSTCQFYSLKDKRSLKKNYQLGNIGLICHQILRKKNERSEWQLVKGANILILGRVQVSFSFPLVMKISFLIKIPRWSQECRLWVI